MHQLIRDHLEDYLKGPAGEFPQPFHAHLAGCEDCATKLRLYEMQAEMLRALRAPDEAEPRAGFYARVMERIDAQGRASIWSVLLQPAIGRRLAVACATLVLVLGTYFVTAELSEPMVAVAPTMASAPSPAAPESTRPQTMVREDNRQRDAVLVNLASFHE